MRTRGVCAVALVFLLLTGSVAARADDAATELPTADEVLDALKRTLAWSQQARGAAQAAREAGVVFRVREEEPTALRAVQVAFEVAGAQAAVLAQPQNAQPSALTPAARRAQRRASLEAAIREGEQELARLRARTVPRSRRAALEQEITRTEHRLALDRLRLELLTSLEQADVSLGSEEADLTQQIEALHETVPELNASSASAKSAPAQEAVVAPTAPVPATGTWGVVRRLLALQRARTQLSQLHRATADLTGKVDAEVGRTRTMVRDLSRRLRDQVSAAPGDPGTEQEFDRQLQRVKLLSAALVPLRTERALLRRFASDLQTWLRTVDRESRKGLQDLAVGLAGVVIALGVIGLGALAWRIAVMRYVRDPYRRRLLLRTRNIVAGAAVLLVIVFHFTSELTALVTAMGFAAAGIAFALQNVILSVAGYFSMMSPHGIRLGDRVSLQGPFGYVHGEVLEIGLVRIRLRELAGDTLEPTGRVVVFPNSVVFTGSFFKHPPAPAKAA